VTSRAQTIVEDIGRKLATLSFTYFDAGQYSLRKSPSSFPVVVFDVNEHNVDGEDPPSQIGWYFGRLAMKRNDRPPRVTWIPVTGTIGPTTNRANKYVGALSTRPGLERILAFDVQINGLDYEQTENMLHAVIAAANACGHVGIRYEGETWPTEADGADYGRDGSLVILSATAYIPVLFDESGSAILDRVTTTSVVLT